MANVLLVDDDPAILRLVERELAQEGLTSVSAETEDAALELFRQASPDVIVLDLMLPDTSGKLLLEQFQAEQPELPVVVLTARDTLEDVVDCMRLGAVDYVPKPFERTRLVTSIRNAMTQGQLRRRVKTLSDELRRDQGLCTIRGGSPAIEKAKALLARAAESTVTVLLLGESGTGKEVAARAIHAEGERRAGPFVAVNCGAIPEGLIESELFGHAKGAFTGADRAKPGRFEQADGGTILLDEIGELRTDLQVRLLRVLQERTVQRVGGQKQIGVDVRVLAATNRDLKAEVAERRFREDLYYRLAVFPVELPPLRDRDGDVPLLAEHFLERYARHHRREMRGISAKAKQALQSYVWPGNVRELENVIERAVILEDGESISLGSLSDEVVCALDDSVASGEPAESIALAENVQDIRPFAEEEQRIIERALQLTDWNVLDASRRLGLGRATLYRKIERYGLRS